jgi:hypothetical protein
MPSGRHFLLLGILACAGLISVHYGQEQIDSCYKIASLEKDLRTVRQQIELSKIKYRALQSPRAVMMKAAELKLKVAPILPESNAPDRQPVKIKVEAPRSLGVPQAATKLLPQTTKTPKNAGPNTNNPQRRKAD